MVNRESGWITIGESMYTLIINAKIQTKSEKKVLYLIEILVRGVWSSVEGDETGTHRERWLYDRKCAIDGKWSKIEIVISARIGIVVVFTKKMVTSNATKSMLLN